MGKKVFVYLLGISLLTGCGAEDLSIGEKIERARLLSDRDRIDESLQILKEVTVREPKNANAFYLTGVTLEKRQSLELAKAAYDDCLEIEPSNSDALNNRGVIHAKLGDSDAALKDLLQATSLNAEDALAWSNLALAQHDQGLNQDAISSYQRAIAIRNDSRFLFQLGNVYLDLANWDEAESAYSKAIEADNQNANAILNRVTVYIEKKKFDLARQDLERVKSLDHDLVLRSSIEERSKILSQKESPTKERALVTQWLESQGWKLDATESESSLLSVSRLSDSSTASLVLMRMDESGQAVCNASDAEAATKSLSPVLLMVIDPRLFVTAEPEASKAPLWLVDANFDWKPNASDFAPKTVSYQSASRQPLEAPLPPK
jgi:tetratricopeptide (TPR) repeat protein